MLHEVPSKVSQLEKAAVDDVSPPHAYIKPDVAIRKSTQSFFKKCHLIIWTKGLLTFGTRARRKPWNIAMPTPFNEYLASVAMVAQVVLTQETQANTKDARAHTYSHNSHLN